VRQYVHRRVLLAAGFSQWLGRKGINVEQVSGKHPAQYLRHRASKKCVVSSDRPSLKQFMEFLRREGIIATEKADFPHAPVEQCVQEFRTYLQDQRALAPGTVYERAISPSISSISRGVSSGKASRISWASGSRTSRNPESRSRRKAQRVRWCSSSASARLPRDPASKA